MLPKIKLNENSIRLAYKLSVDFFFLNLFFFIPVILVESVIPGIITSHIGFSKIIILLLISLLLVIFISRLGKSENKTKQEKTNSPQSIFLWFFLIATVIANQLFRINSLLNLFLTATCVAASFWLYKLFFEKES